MTWVSLATAMKVLCSSFGLWSVLLRSLSGEHGCEGARIEDGANLGNPLALDLIPFANKYGPRGRVGDHVVKDAYIVAIGENLFHIDSLNDRMQFFQGLEIRLGAMKSVDGALEQ